MSQDITSRAPKNFFRIGMNLETSEKTVVIPGSLYVEGDICAPNTDMTIKGDLYFTGKIVDCTALHVYGKIYHCTPSPEEE